MTRKNTTTPVIEQVLSCILQFEETGASASEVSSEILIPVKTVLEKIGELVEAGQLHATDIRRPWRHNPSEGQAPIRQVYVAMQFREAS